MKAGAEVHFISGQMFMIGVALITIVPRLPFDTNLSIGGRLSFPFRRALVWLISIGIIRTLSCHLHHPKSVSLAVVDAILGTVQAVGQSFLCLTTAYILRCQMQGVIHIEGGGPGQSLMPYFIIVLLLTSMGAVLSRAAHPNWWCLENLAEALSCLPVLKTLSLYASLTTAHNGGRGSVLVQILRVTECWFFVTALLCCFAEAIDRVHGDLNKLQEGSDDWWGVRIILEAIRSNQDSGIDDYTRLLVHSIFLNCMDELHHFTGGFSRAEDPPSPYMDDVEIGEKMETVALTRRR